MTEQKRRYRSQQWFDDPHNDNTALYIDRAIASGITVEELQSGKPIIGIAQTGSDIVPCNKHHVQLAQRVKDGIRAAGGIPLEFPVYPLQETFIRPTAALHRNLATLTSIEIMDSYPFDGFVLTTGCDKTTGALLMAAATVNLPAIVLSGGPMLDGEWNNRKVGAGTVIWEARQMKAKGEIDYKEFIRMAAASTPSRGHCNSMGTALSMNSLAEALGMSLPGCASIPAPYTEREHMAYQTGVAAVALVEKDIRPSQIMTKKAFENAIAVAAAIGGSTNCPPHLIGIAKHMGVELNLQDWQRIGANLPLIVNCQPAGTHLGEGFHRAGGVPAVINELMTKGKIHEDALTVNLSNIGDNNRNRPSTNRDVIMAYDKPLKPNAGFIVLSGNIFDEGIMKTSVIGEEFRSRYLSKPGSENAFTARAIVFDGPEDYHHRIEDPSLKIDANCVLVMRYCGPLGYPGSAEVVNMQPPAYLLKQGITSLPTMGDGRQSGTSASPSILNISPEAAAGGNLAILQTGDMVRIDLNKRTVNMQVSAEEMTRRREALKPFDPQNRTPWQELYRANVGQLADGACLPLATKYHNISVGEGCVRPGERHPVDHPAPRHSH